MSFSISLNGTQLTIHFRERGNYRFFNEVCSEIIRRENTVVINEIVIEVDGINYLIPNGIEKIHNGVTEDEILLDKTILDPHQLEKEKDLLKEKARVAFESSDAVKKIKKKEAAALIKKQEQEKERIDNEEPVWFYSKDVKTREGPISFNELKNIHKNKTIEDDTLVWSPKLDEWEEAYKIINKQYKNSEKLPDKEPVTLLSEPKEEKVSHIDSSEVLSTNEDKQSMKVFWLIIHVIAIVLISVLLKLMIISDGVNPILIISKSSPDLIMRIIADTAGIYVFALLFGLFGLFFKTHRALGFVLASWGGLLFMIYISFFR